MGPTNFPNLLNDQSSSSMRTMPDSAQDNAGSIHQTEPPVTQGPDIPKTDDDWFALIRPAIEMSPEDAEEDIVTELAQRHAQQVVECTDMAVDLDQITWRATYELQAKHGYCRNNFVKLSLNSLETNGWQPLMTTVRHELVHAWQHQNDVDDRPGKDTFERFHGPSFEQWMPILNIHKRSGRVLPPWTIECPECQARIDTKLTVRDKEIAHLIQTLDTTECYRCEHVLSEPTVKRDGDEVAVESLPDVLSEEQDQIFLYDKTMTESQSDEHGPGQQTRRLTALTGIGEATARTLGDAITRIDELLDVEDGRLTEKVRSAVSARYHDTLRVEVRHWYQTALRNRSPDELDPIEKKYLRGDVGWKVKTEDIDATDNPKLMCLLLRDGADPNDRFRITTDEYDDITVQVVKKSDEEQTCIHVTIEPESTPLAAEGIIEIPPPYRGKHPVMRGRQDPPDSHPINSGSSASGVLYQQEITAVETKGTPS